MQSFGGNHAVKWILVDWWKASRAIKHDSLEWQNLDILQPQLLFNPILRRRWQRQLARAVLERDLPHRGQAQYPIICLIVESFGRLRPQQLGRACQPDEGTSIQ